MKNDQLTKKRTKKGLSQVEVAKQAGISETSYQRIEYGKQIPSLSTAFKLAEILGTSVDALFKNQFN
ncbi:helix-turn-helix transcriptional regulator [Enterococcus avium]|uniref:helix-turn-helix transcriptional regulator n=1 Tax=Enterococcus avium TaxID=33945 RepID=UPI001F57C978|nr:helix-turn-helix transcriptional regulator [Enterococcus avium]